MLGAIHLLNSIRSPPWSTRLKQFLEHGYIFLGLYFTTLLSVTLTPALGQLLEGTLTASLHWDSSTHMPRLRRLHSTKRGSPLDPHVQLVGVDGVAQAAGEAVGAMVSPVGQGRSWEV